MDVLTIFVLLSILFFILFMLSVMAESDVLMWICGIVLTVSIVMSAFLALYYYSESYNLPQKYIEANNTVNEINELLLRHENRTVDNSTMINNVDLALESQQLKLRLSDAIERRNELRARINTWLSNPLIPYKERLRSNLPDDWEVER